MPSSPEPENPPPAPEIRRRPQIGDLLAAGVGIRSVALTVLMLLGVLYTLYFARSFLLPIVLAILLSLLFAPLVRTLQQRLRIPAGIGAAVVLLGILGAIGTGAAFVIEPANAWIQTVPERIPELQSRLKAFQRPIEKVRAASEQVQQLTDLNRRADQPTVKLGGGGPADLFMTQTPAFLANLFVMIILLYFMLASGDLFLRKLVRMIPTFPDKRRAVEIAHEIESRVARYLRTVTVINLGLGAAIGLAAWLVGFENFILWGVLGFLLNFVPYVGALVGVLATLVVGLLTFESTLQAFALPAIYLALNTIEGNFLTPIIVGRILTLNPVMIFLSIMFWGWIWGIPGALLAVPILAVFKIVCDHLPPLAPIGAFVGGEPDEGTEAG